MFSMFDEALRPLALGAERIRRVAEFAASKAKPASEKCKGLSLPLDFPCARCRRMTIGPEHARYCSYCGDHVRARLS